MLDEAPVVDERMHRQQLDRRHAQVREVGDDGGGREARERPAQRRLHARMVDREPFDVQLVEHRVGPRHRGPGVVAPGERALDDDALLHRARVVAAVEREVLAVRADPVAVVRVGPAQLSRQRLRVRVEQQLVVVEAVSALGVVRPVHAVAVQHTGARVGQITVPHLVGVLGQRDAAELPPAAPVEHAQLDLFGMRAEQCEVHALAVPRRAQRVRQARLDAQPGRDHGNRDRVMRARARSSRAAAASGKRRTGARAQGGRSRSRSPRYPRSCRRTRTRRC